MELQLRSGAWSRSPGSSEAFPFKLTALRVTVIAGPTNTPRRSLVGGPERGISRRVSRPDSLHRELEKTVHEDAGCRSQVMGAPLVAAAGRGVWCRLRSRHLA